MRKNIWTLSLRWYAINGDGICIRGRLSGALGPLKESAKIVAPEQAKTNEALAYHQLYAAAAPVRALEKKANAAIGTLGRFPAPAGAGKYLALVSG